MFKLALVFGTRPEAIKMAPWLRPAGVGHWDTRVIITGQHREMVDQVLELFGIEPDYDLDIMSHGQTLTDISQRTLRGMAGILRVAPGSGFGSRGYQYRLCRGLSRLLRAHPRGARGGGAAHSFCAEPLSRRGQPAPH